VRLHATGTFDVKLAPLANEETAGGKTFARMSAAKEFHGDIEGSSIGQMLSWGNPAGSAVYVAVERVTGVVKGRSGSFVLHHTGIMAAGKPSLTVSVAPGSGEGALAGISGQLAITIEGGKHLYDFEFSLPDAAP
jgi:hypothetical protein